MDTITALATGTGGAISLIRLSGPDALRIADSVFRSASGPPLVQREGYTISYGRIVDTNAETVDEVLVSVFRAPKSYTGEEMAEISAHASPYVCRRILDLLVQAGARMAEPGEFTVRAFLSGKMDLSQAEAVGDLIASADRASHALAMNQMRGGYSCEFAALREELLHLASLVELELDFSEEDVTFADRHALDSIMERAERHIESLIDSFSLGNAVKEGIPVAIVGEPNVGKSTLLNVLLNEDRAMVSDIAGTTRDVIEESIVLAGMRYRFLDTAGLRATEDPLERMGIRRTHDSIERARIILWMVDATDYTAGQPPPFSVREDQQVCLVLNKIDRIDGAGTGSAFPVTGAIAGEQLQISGAGSRMAQAQPSRLYPLAENEQGLHVDQGALNPNHDASGNPGVPESGSGDFGSIVLGSGYVHGEGRYFPIVALSAKKGINIEAITHFLTHAVAAAPLYDGSAVVSSARHHEALRHAAEALSRARTALADNLSTDLLAEELRQALHYIGLITGEITTDEILGEVFSGFCIGK